MTFAISGSGTAGVTVKNSRKNSGCSKERSPCPEPPLSHPVSPSSLPLFLTPFPLWPSLLRPWLPSGIWWNNNRTSGEGSWWAKASFPMRYDAVEPLHCWINDRLDRKKKLRESKIEVLSDLSYKFWNYFVESFENWVNFRLSNDFLKRRKFEESNLTSKGYYSWTWWKAVFYILSRIYSSIAFDDFLRFPKSRHHMTRKRITLNLEPFRLECVNSFSSKTNHEECSVPSISLVPSPTVSRTLSRETHHSVAIHALAIVFLQNAPSCLRTQGRCSLDRRAREEYA